MKRKTGMRTAVLFVLLLALLLPATSCSYLPKIMKSFKKGLTKEEQAEVDRTVRDYNDRILDTTWRNDKWGSYRFLADGSVEEDGEISEPGNWEIRFGGEYDGALPVSEMNRNQIKSSCDYYIHFDSALYPDKRYHLKIHFTDSGNLVLGEIEYAPGIDVIHEVPEDAYIDPFFTANPWGRTYEDGKVGAYWVLQDDGLGAETIGIFGGEFVYPDTFYWSYKDGYLYIDWTYQNEDGSEEHYKLDIYEVKKGEGEFYTTDYLKTADTVSEHWKAVSWESMNLQTFEEE